MKNAEKDEAIARLREWIKPGATLYTILRHVSRSGMNRVIEVVQLREDGEVRVLGFNIALAVGYSYDRQRDGIKVGGCGSDMGFEVVYNLGRVLFPDGFEVKGVGRNGDTSGWDNDGGYALRQRWL